MDPVAAKYVGAGLAAIGMGAAAIGVGVIFGAALAEGLGIFAFLVAIIRLSVK